VAAHDAAVAAAAALGTFLDNGDTSAADAFLERIGAFLATLAAADPEGFSALLADLKSRAETLDPYCREELRPVYESNAETLEGVATLLRQTWDRAQSVQSGGDHA
jgi:hypothetical protein